METAKQPSKKDSQKELLDEDYLMNILRGGLERWETKSGWMLYF